MKVDSPKDRPSSLRTHVLWLYEGVGVWPRRFRYVVLTFDLVTIVFFVAMTFWTDALPIYLLDAAIGLILAADIGARGWIARSKQRYFLQPTTIADIVVVISLFTAVLFENLAFLRVLRALRLLRSYHIARDLRRRYHFFRNHEDVIASVLNLVVFIFVISAIVYVVQARTNPLIANYIDALYYTVATLTTTGFGDVTLTGNGGRLLSILVMVFGVGLFLRLVQTIFRPQKVVYPCPDCGLNRHDPDAVHCKHCGRMVNIETEGA